MRKDRIGEKFKNKKGENYTIIEYNTFKDCVIQFEDGTIIKNLIYSNVRKGEVKNPNFPAILGVGYIGVGKYKASDDNKKHNKIYLTWYCMFQRCYSELHQIKAKTYKDCSVVEEWHNFQNFAQWYENNYVEGFELDKDILVKGNKMYSPKTCCFILKEINNVFKGSKQGKFTRGVNAAGNKFRASYQSKHIGSYSTPEQAFQAYKTAKEKHIKEVAEKYKNQITKEVYNALYNYQVEITD